MLLTTAVWLLLLLVLLLVLCGVAVASGFAARALYTGVRLPDPPPTVSVDRRGRAALSLAAREWLSTARVALTWPLGLLNGSAPELLSPDGSRPVLLLPGYGLTRASLWPLQGWLRQRGAEVCSWTPPLFAPPRHAAARLGSRLRAVSAGAGNQPVDVVAFGGSGLLVAEVLAGDPDCPIGRLVALGTPWRGAPGSVYLPGAGAVALLPHRPEVAYWNDVLARAASAPLAATDGSGAPDPTPRQISIRSSDDLWVPPELGGPPDGGVEHLLHGAGHLHLLHHAEAREAVLAALRPHQTALPEPTTTGAPS